MVILRNRSPEKVNNTLTLTQLTVGLALSALLAPRSAFLLTSTVCKLAHVQAVVKAPLRHE